MATTPSSVALASIADGSSMVASPVRNNFADIQTALNALITILAGGTSAQVLTSSGGTTIGWAAPTTVTYRKTTSKIVNTTVAATDLLNAEITIAAAAMGSTGILRGSVWGELLNNSGGAAAPPRLQLLLGGSTIFDTGTSGTVNNSATRGVWQLDFEILNLTASSQESRFDFHVAIANSGTVNNAFTTGLGTYTSYDGTLGRMLVAQATRSGTTVNTASAAALVLNVINGSASASYETKLLGALVEVI